MTSTEGAPRKKNKPEKIKVGKNGVSVPASVLKSANTPGAINIYNASHKAGEGKKWRDKYISLLESQLEEARRNLPPAPRAATQTL